MAWHSTRSREELVVALTGRVQLELQSHTGRVRTVRLSAGQSAFLPSRVVHRLVNRWREPATYLYITGSCR